RQAAAAHRTKLYLKPGQVLPLRGLLEAMLIRSANDACLAAVEHVGGDEESFVAKMNAKAAAIGLPRTHFQNACGFDMPNHFSTAEDLAVMTEYAMGHETFASIVREPAAVIRTTDQRKTYLARTTNRLLGTMDGVIGVKTGYTRGAGRCLITVVTRDGRELLLVLLNAHQRGKEDHQCSPFVIQLGERSLVLGELLLAEQLPGLVDSLAPQYKTKNPRGQMGEPLGDENIVHLAVHQPDSRHRIAGIALVEHHDKDVLHIHPYAGDLDLDEIVLDLRLRIPQLDAEQRDIRGIELRKIRHLGFSQFVWLGAHRRRRQNDQRTSPDGRTQAVQPLPHAAPPF
ncbi:MAG: D-alanyl-D-alanine carboxypeptidase, partial [Nitrospirae bacterium]|nr:D-alanyl-D-alanine carboxypeptidase [Nitrospirota bacterium]